MVRILAPVLVLLTLLLAAGLAILGRYMLQWRKKGEQRWLGVGGGRLLAGDLTETYSPPNTPERPCGSVCLFELWVPGVLLLPSEGTQGCQQQKRAIQRGALGLLTSA